MDVHKDYYAELELNSSATEQEIKDAYRTLVRRFHPDISVEPNAEERFRQIQEAYEILNDPVQKEAYDLWREKEGLSERSTLVVKQTLSHQSLAQLQEEQVLYLLLEIYPRPGLSRTI